ncbi:MAG TPA: cation:proton antiporter [Chryseolinea sp.]|nr:cation:proton antiporter [Chryseolinea sp.]
MAHLPHFIVDLALILGVAGVTTLIFRKINQPVVLGYIIAGFLVGPHVSLFPTVADSEGVRLWSEIGVIFLLFSLGLEFSFKKLAKVGGAASVTAIVEIAVMIGLGFLTGQLMGWTLMDSIFLGAVLAISSTTIIIRAFDEVGVRTRKFAMLVFGILIVEDLVAILLLVVLSTFAVSQQFAGSELLTQIFKLVFFLTLWVLGGIFLVPTFLKRTRKLMNDETMLIVSLALCLLMVVLAVKAGFSAALGAFIMGSILAETSQAERIEHLVKSVKDLFAAIFFVSVGMMIDPNVLLEYAVEITIITLIRVLVKLIATSLGALLAGQSLKHSIQAGMSLAPIGEFSFIIAALGVSLNVTSGFLYPIVVAISALTTFTTPFLIRQSGTVFNFIEARLPQRWLKAINRYSSGSQQLSAYSEWKELLRGYAMNAIIHSLIIGALIFLSQRYLRPFTQEHFPNSTTATVVSVLVTLIITVPFFWAIAIRRINKDAYRNLWLNRKIKRGPLIVIELARICLSILLITILINIYFSFSVAVLVAVVAMALAIVVFNKRLQSFYERMERSFLTNFNERESLKLVRPEITPWDAHLATFDVEPEFPFSGKQLRELRLREKYGVNIALIERGKSSIISPDRYEKLYPGDKLSIIGTDDQLSAIKEVFKNTNDNSESDVDKDEIVLQNFTVKQDSKLLRRTIRESGIRDEAQALVVGLERDGQRNLNPESMLILLEGDIVWIVGPKNKITKYLWSEEKS